VINQTVGDALSDMLLVETVLLHRQWLPSEWDSAYSDLPNRLVKVYVKDRHAFTTEDAERKVVTPQGLQAKVDQAVGAVEGGRSFVRPSGTEDCVRVYAEAKTRETADGTFFQLFSKSQWRERELMYWILSREKNRVGAESCGNRFRFGGER